ncbi:hypothetical protein CYMTET_32025, partial [Cymbomonas tetramitiformis]
AYAQWMFGPLFQFSVEDVERLVPEWMRSLTDVLPRVAINPQAMCRDLQTKLHEFEERIPLISCLRNPGLRERHWGQICKLTGISQDVDRSAFTLEQLMAMRMDVFVPDILEISDIATKEANVERTLDKIVAQWSTQELELREFKDTKHDTLTKTSELFDQLDDATLTVQLLTVSAFVSPHHERVVFWVQNLNQIKVLLETWMAAQGKWVHLHPLFANPTVKEQIPQLAKEFDQASKVWREITLEASKSAHRVILEVAGKKSILTKLEETAEALERVQHNLTYFLEAKRKLFPRLYFMSDDELLSLLLKAERPAESAQYLLKVFEGISTVTLASEVDARARSAKLKASYKKAPTGRRFGLDWLDLELAAEVVAKEKEQRARSQSRLQMLSEHNEREDTEEDRIHSEQAELEARLRVPHCQSYVAHAPLLAAAPANRPPVHEATPADPPAPVATDAKPERLSSASFAPCMKEKNVITTIGTPDGELLDISPVFLHQSEGNEYRHVEEWLVDVEHGMQNRLQALIELASNQALRHNSLKQWIFFFPSQVVHMVLAMRFAHSVDKELLYERKTASEEVARAVRLSRQDPSGRKRASTVAAQRTGVIKHFTQTLEVIDTTLEEVLELVRRKEQGMTASQRQFLSTICATTLHHRDVIERLKEDPTMLTHEHNFEWVRQLRYYAKSRRTRTFSRADSVESGNGRARLSRTSSTRISRVSRDRGANELTPESSEDGFEVSEESNGIFLSCVDCAIPYEFELLASTRRIITTPLTERSFVTLITALHHLYGGEVSGGAATGKSETVKDLAKAAARPMKVFNCSEQLGVGTLRRFLRGIVGVGAWACFDEFDRIPSEVISIVTHQIAQIYTALRASNDDQLKIGLFYNVAGPSETTMAGYEDENVPLQRSFAMFLTLDPGLLQKQAKTLPSNLRALFRPMFMTQPDGMLIAEVYLHAQGFEKWKELAFKMSAVLRLASQQLPASRHYTWGLRILRATLTTAAHFKHMTISEAEEDIVQRAISKCPSCGHCLSRSTTDSSAFAAREGRE